MLDTLILLIISLGIGIISTMLGIGGGVFIIMALVFLYNVSYVTSVSVSLSSMIALTIAGSIIYYKRKLVDLKLGLLFQMLTVSGAYLGAIATTIIPSNYLKIIFGFFLIVMGYLMLRNRGETSSKINVADKIIERRIVLGSGKEVVYHIPIFFSLISIFIAGLLAGLLGIGGGLIVVPLLTLVCGFPIHIAIANSTFIMMATSISGALTHSFLGHTDLYLTLIVSLGYFIGGLIGPNITLKTNKKILKLLLEPVIIYASIRMLYEGFITFL